MKDRKSFNGKKVVSVIVAHPDDVEICCFGTLKKLKESNVQIEILIMTNGSRGVEVTKKKTELASVVSSGYRMKEAEKALNEMDNIHWGDFPDGNLKVDSQTISFVDRFLKKVKPDLIITHPSALPADHHDHYVTHTAVKNCIQRLPKACEVWYFEPIISARIGWKPNLLVDITPFFEDKLQAMKVHQTQAGRIYLTEEWHLHRSKQNALSTNPNLFNNGSVYESFQAENLIL